jgi:tetratricopeptide (TPR) repeat protein
MPVLLLAIALIALAAAAIAGAVLSGGDDGSSQSGNNSPAAPAKKKPAEPKKKPKAKKEKPEKSEEPAAPAPSGEEGTSYDTARGAQLNSQGFDLMNQGDYDGAIPVLQQAVKSFPPGTSDVNYAYALFNLGKSLRLARRYDEAIQVLEQRLKIPNQSDTVQRELDLAKQQAGEG